MSHPASLPKPRLLAAMVAILLAATTRAEDDHVVHQPEAATAQADQPNTIDLGANFDANLFEQQGNGWMLRGGNAAVAGQLFLGNGRLVQLGNVAVAPERPPESPSFARARALGEKRLERIAAACDLDDAQRRKLRLAMESDIRRFAAAIDATRAKYAGVKVDLNNQEGQKRWQEFQHDVQQCRQELRRLFDAGSLFAAALPSTLAPTQLAAIEGELRARRTFRWRAMVAATLVKMDDTLGLTAEQHDLIEEKLLAAEPRLRTEDLAPDGENAHLQQNLVYLVLSGVDALPLQKAVSERQWRTLALLMNQGKSMRSWIEQQGILDVGPETPDRPRRRSNTGPR